MATLLQKCESAAEGKVAEGPSQVTSYAEPETLGGVGGSVETSVGDLPPEYVQLVDILSEEQQSHLFKSWPPRGVGEADKRRFFQQVSRLNKSYPGGLRTYIRNARSLLADSRDGKNPFDGYTPSVPSGVRLHVGDEAFNAFESLGVRSARSAAFVLVAGGLGERLGYSGIKVALPCESTSGWCFLRLYIESILALQDASNKLFPDEPARKIPLAIMTSDDTRAATQALLEEGQYFGMDKGQIILLKQEKVACLAEEARLALDPKDPFLIQTKPHGHGDVHMLLYGSGTIETWHKSGVEWVLFFQDTNALLFKAIPASLGVSVSRGFDVNSLAVPRKAKEAIGGIARLRHIDGREMVINVEYNQLDPLLRATKEFVDGDVNDPSTGFSPFPGNINQLVVKLGPYRAELSRTKGAIPEFVNPKYKDSSRMSFKSSTRLECMMQDYPKSLSSSSSIGFTVVDVWLGYSPVKNNAADAAVKLTAGTPAHSATTGEADIYRANCKLLQLVGASVEGPIVKTFAGQAVEWWPRIVWSPRWALTLADLHRKLPRSPDGRNTRLTVSQSSTLFLDGEDIVIDRLTLDGCLVVKPAAGCKVDICNLTIRNQGWEMKPVSESEEVAEEIRMRGFKVLKHAEILMSSRQQQQATIFTVEGI